MARDLRRVLFLRSNPVDPDPRVEKEAISLARAGYNVAVLAWDRYACSPLTEQRGPFRIDRLRILSEYGTGLQNLPTLMRWQLNLLRWLIRRRESFDLIHACDFDTVIPALILQQLSGKKVIYDIFDFYADHLRATPVWIKKLIRWLDLRCIDHADAVILADEARRRQIDGANPRRLAVIYNSPQDWVGNAKGCEPTKNDDGLTIVFVGLLQKERGIFELFEVLKRHPTWALELAGYGGDEAELQNQAREMPNVRWHGRVSYDRAMEISSRADVFLATYDPSLPNHKYASPNKVFEAMMFGKPVIVARHTNVDTLIERHQCGLVVEYGVVDQLEESLTCLEGSPALRARLGANGRRVYEQRFRWPKMEERLIKLYASLA